MIKEWQITESLRDATHAFKRSPASEVCVRCSRPRWAHVDDGHRSPPEHKYSISDTKYRPGPHPYWYRPGTFNKKDNKKTPFPAHFPSDGVLSRVEPTCREAAQVTGAGN